MIHIMACRLSGESLLKPKGTNFREIPTKPRYFHLERILKYGLAL